MENNGLRIQKYLSDCGVMSRRKAEEEIRDGKIFVNGKVAEIGQKINPTNDVVMYRGKIVERSEQKLYIMLNKPRGYVSTMSDDKDRRCVADLVKDVNSRVYPIGRLDYNSEGLLLFTNDGEIANRLIHPKSDIEKVYLVRVKGRATAEQLEMLNKSMVIEGYRIRPCNVSVEDDSSENQLLRFVLHEGRNRQIRRMCEQVGLFVTRLKRISVGKIFLSGLGSGKWRSLSKTEIDYLKKL
ncbi:MAG: rRNA pseudouridine synthase [Ruminococcaceae bacterium]|nr:rRNA pseudouridine synthase [Oscillospiraceae bacterium]